MDRPSNSTRAVSATRRTVIRAGFAVPALTTVACGSALAATSASCLSKQIASPDYPGVTTSLSPDSYLRVQLVKRVQGQTTTYYVSGNAIANLKDTEGNTIPRSPSYTVTDGKYQLFDIGTNAESGLVLSALPPGGQYTQTGGQYAALRFNLDGEIVGVGKGGTGTSAVGGSCWNSLSPSTSP